MNISVSYKGKVERDEKEIKETAEELSNDLSNDGDKDESEGDDDLVEVSSASILANASASSSRDCQLLNSTFNDTLVFDSPDNTVNSNVINRPLNKNNKLVLGGELSQLVYSKKRAN